MLKLDENLPTELADDLRQRGHDVETVVEEDLAGASDPRVARRAAEERRALLTMDKGLADVRSYPPEQYAGLVLLRPPSAGRDSVRQFVLQRMEALEATELARRLVVVTQTNMRIYRGVERG